MEDFKKIRYDYNHRTTRYTFYMNNIKKFKKALETVTGKSFTKYLFKNETTSKFEIREFFLLELHFVLKLIKSDYPSVGLDIGGIYLNNLIEFLETVTWLRNRYIVDTDKLFDLNHLKRNMKFLPMKHQLEGFKKYEEVKEMSNLSGFMLDAEPGTGKDLINGTKVLVPNGSRVIESLKVGDVVIGNDGLHTKVTGVYPQGYKEQIKLTFKDGRESICGLGHLWETIVNDSTMLLDTYEIITLMDNNMKVSIPLYKPELSISKIDVIPTSFKLGVFIDATTKLKSIHSPIGDYFTLPLSYRYNLLQGLLSTTMIDFTGNTLIYKVKDIRLAKSLIEVIHSIGDIATMEKNKDDYDLHITSRNLKVYRKGYILDINDFNNDLNLELVRHESIGKFESTCISVDNESKLFVIEDYLVTHNTYMSLALSELLDYELVIIVAPKNTLHEVWLKSVTETLYKRKQTAVVLGTDSKEYNDEKFIITHYEYLKKLSLDKKLARRIKKLKPMLIVDEFHNFNEITSGRIQVLRDFVTYMKFTDIALLTGTPIKMRLKELIPMLYLVDNRFPKAREDFEDYYANLQGIKIDMIRHRFNLYKKRIQSTNTNKGEIEIKEFKISLKNGNDFTMEAISSRMTEYKHTRLLELESNMDSYKIEFNNLITQARTTMINKGLLIKDIDATLKEYRTYVKTIKSYSDKGKLYRIYDIVNKASTIEKEFITKYLDGGFKKHFRHIASIVKYPKFKVLGEALGKILLGSRIECYKGLAENLEYKNLLGITNKKGLVFSNYVSVCDAVITKCRLEGFNPIGVYGEHMENLNSNVKLFNDLSTDVNPIVATYKGLGTGVPLTSANVVILIDTALRSFTLEQAISRSYRIGNNHKVTCIFIKLDTGTEYNITERDLYIVNTSEYNVEMITGNKPIYDIPRQTLESPDDDTDVISEELEEELEEVISTTLLNANLMDTNIIIDYVKKIMKTIKII